MPEARSKVLFIDSEATLTLALSDALEDARLSFSPLLARTSDEALALLRDDPAIALIVLDLGLPEGGGSFLAHRILTDFPRTKLILTSTGLCDEEMAEFEGRAIGLLEKPFDLEDFVQLSHQGLVAL